MAKRYVVGFLFDDSCKRVVLIRKTRPDWQRGRLNGVGGKVEVGETNLDAMAREFGEETGSKRTFEWAEYAQLHGVDRNMEGFTVAFFCAQTPEPLPTNQSSDEEVSIYTVGNFRILPCIPNINWLVPMAVNRLQGNESCSWFHIDEVQRLQEQLNAQMR